MKKVVSLILVVALFAGLAVFASADGVAVVHEQSNPVLTEPQSAMEIRGEVEHGLHWPTRGDTRCATYYTWASAAAAAAGNAEDVMIVNPETGANIRFRLGRTSCAEAITVDEMKAIIDSRDDINNLTVFYQRNVDETQAGTYDITLWPCNPEKKPNQTLVVLSRDDGGEWSVLATAKTQTVKGVSIAAGDIAVCMAW